MKDKLKEELKAAMKQKDKIRMETIRSILSAFQYEEMQKGVEDLPSDVTVQLLQRELKKRHEEKEYAEKANRTELIEQLNKEVAVIESFLPKQLAAQDLETIIAGWKSADAGINMGVIMKQLKEQYAGQYDGKLASEVVKKVLG